MMRKTGSLALRVLVVCAVLLIIPLLFHTAILYRQEDRIKLKELFLELTLFAGGRQQILEEMIFLKKEELRLIALSVDGMTKAGAEAFVKRCKGEIKATTLAFLGEVKPFKDERDRLAFLGSAPVTEEEQIFLSKGTRFGEILLGIDAHQVMSRLSASNEKPYAVSLALFDRDHFFQSDGSEKSLESFEIYSTGAIEKEFLREKTEKKAIGLKLPIQGSSFSLLIEVPRDELINLERRQLFSRLFSLFFLSLIIGGLGAFWLTRRMARPLKNLCLVMERIGQGDLKARFQRDWMGFEINVLGSDFNRMIDSLLLSMEEAKNERVGRELLANEFKIGHEIQTSIFPKEMPHVPGVEIASGFLAAQEVAGDFYDIYFKESQNQLMMAIADAAGKGISACIYSLGVRSMLRSFTASHEDFSEVIRLTNDLFCQDTGDTGSFVTAWVGNLDLASRKLTFSSCGHPPALLKRKTGELEELTTANPALGVMPFERVEVSSVFLLPGDLLLLYTDGVIEAHDKMMQRFGKARLFELVDAAKDKSAEEMVDYFMKKVAEFEEGSAQFDDLTLLIVRIL
jgi:serine phosphatase RsbU (regulator of sigma subunit)